MPEQEGFGKQSKHRISNPLCSKSISTSTSKTQDRQQRHQSRPESDNLTAKGEARYVYAECGMEDLSLHDHNNGQGGRRGAPPPPPPLPHGHRGYPQQPNPATHSGFPRHHQPAPPTAPPPAPGQEPSPTPMMPPPLAQLPPQMFTTAAQLLDLTDTNLVLQGTVERLYAGNLFADIQRGIYLVRGENVLLLGEVDLDKEDDIPTGYRQAPFEEVFALKKQEDNERKKRNKRSSAKLQTLGFEAEHSGEVLF
ncbi:predicted protein [Histoplasma mississippiense (nom. inval.)]|uniref:predicted protein n=1 Tax=Ajellomyces capsulatus (strain NAm1 / WU24) TaxID=2059318 RepID=UPI000157C23E|nr:predicted protein [Histoplasma mississippiense (nom. inval.)]EDN07403.1 predicted protein [Histoplasma mississippiense (nom. inval.)]